MELGRRKEIKIFLAEKNQPEPLLSDVEWLWKLSIFADVVTHVNNLNLKFQGKNNLSFNLFKQTKAFRAKLILLESHMNEWNFSHYTCCEKFRFTELQKLMKDFPLCLQ